MARKLDQIAFAGEDKQFYLYKEVDKHFKEIKLPRINIDIVNINAVVKPKYGPAYPEQQAPPSEASEESEDDSTVLEYRVNTEMLRDTFKSGMAIEGSFPYAVDNLPQIKDVFTLTKVFDS